MHKRNAVSTHLPIPQAPLPSTRYIAICRAPDPHGPCFIEYAEQLRRHHPQAQIRCCRIARHGPLVVRETVHPERQPTGPFQCFVHRRGCNPPVPQSNRRCQRCHGEAQAQGLNELFPGKPEPLQAGHHRHHEDAGCRCQQAGQRSGEASDGQRVPAEFREFRLDPPPRAAGSSPACGTRSSRKGQSPRTSGADKPKPPQYVARPPVKSNTAPVLNEQSSLDNQATIAAISSTSTKRPIGILPSM